LLCRECHNWAHDIGAKASAPELMELRHRRLVEYLNYRDAIDVIHEKELELSKNYGKVIMITESEFYSLSEAIHSYKQRIDELTYLLEIESDIDGD